MNYRLDGGVAVIIGATQRLGLVQVKIFRCWSKACYHEPWCVRLHQCEKRARREKSNSLYPRYS